MGATMRAAFSGAELRRASLLTRPCLCPVLHPPGQFSVTEHFRSVSSREGQGLPGVFFFYELSPIMVKFTETRKSLPHFLTQLCAILGGVFTVAGMLDRLVRRHARTVDGLVDGWGDSGPRRPDAFAAALSNWANDEAVGSRKGIGRADHHRAPRTQIAHCACRRLCCFSRPLISLCSQIYSSFRHMRKKNQQGKLI